MTKFQRLLINEVKVKTNKTYSIRVERVTNDSNKKCLFPLGNVSCNQRNVVADKAKCTMPCKYTTRIYKNFLIICFIRHFIGNVGQFYSKTDNEIGNAVHYRLYSFQTRVRADENENEN